ncbi:hypothetical protein Q8W90_28455 [Pseudomonas aeruginosa]|uniref:hypothetical protein n=1 Tax=Pseudomonas aeruginosa TaxID=287 RepID=UPI001A1E3561|nr:hypothetical protein [Pseudomonas aeruginosa]MBG7282132.1 hypothetical protein [Pseudomonas aeruginosa]MDI3829416.1 hypothetical protein [Pseudomonas aeruginosa]MDU0686165.1 hypothetical protein [Pseudomonas aeruginosa]HBN9565046.1 hypothetical protein [Pseudomonas aeruginosa]HBO3132176.1 hypothetical protein [Pseudomonas aeruginosa]
MVKQRSGADTENQHHEDGGWKVVPKKKRDETTGRFLVMEGYYGHMDWTKAKASSTRFTSMDLKEAQVHIIDLDETSGSAVVFGEVAVRLDRDKVIQAPTIPLVVTYEDLQPLAIAPHRKQLSELIHNAAMTRARVESDSLISETVLDAKTALDLLDNPREPNKALLDLLELN